ncbi:MAG: EAL domain-containing protein [Clostridia bacterium]|nr:EAL domain-containing protein [Clostridia bacterium]
MIDMTILIIGFIAVICLAIAFFGMSGTGNDGSDTPLLSGMSGVKKFYERSLKKKQDCAVMYINIFYENLQTMVDRKELMRIQDQVTDEVLQLCKYGSGEAAKVDGNNYVVVTTCSKDALERFCGSFLEADRKEYKMIEVFMGGYMVSETKTEFLKAAGYAKKAARVTKANKNKYLIADQDDLKLILENDNIERNIENFIDNDGFYQMYQPFLDAHTGEVVGCEVLTRLKEENSKNIMPSQVLNAIKKENLHEKFDMLVFEKCCEWASKRLDWDTIITCKMAKSTLAREGVAQRMINIFSQSGIGENMIVIEMSQDRAERNEEIFKGNIMQLKNAGFNFCLDNFGKGYTSLNDVSSLEPNVIKLDRSLLANGTEGAGRIVFDNVVKLAKEIDAVVFCSGIETAEQKQVAKEAGCDILQGFYFYKPLSEEDFDKVLIEQRGKKKNQPADDTVQESAAAIEEENHAEDGVEERVETAEIPDQTQTDSKEDDVDENDARVIYL